MKVKVTQEILGYDDQPLEISDDGKTTRPFLLRDAIISAVNTTVPEEQLNGNQKAQSYSISIKVRKNTNVDLSVGDLAYILERADKILTPVALGRVRDVLDPKAQADDSPEN